jgi:hypothetical protein
MNHLAKVLLSLAALFLIAPLASADVVTDWNIRAGEVVVAANLGPPPANRVLAIVHTAIYEAVGAATQSASASASSIDAAVAAASHATLAQLVPSQRAGIDGVYQAALARIADGAEKSAGIEIGERAAAVILALRAEDGAATPETYRPYAAPGVYVPTTVPAVPQWPQRKPWLMTSPAQFRPGPPPALTSEVWARDYDEIQAIGAKNSTRRTAEQTAIARFWEATLPTIYHGVVRSVATQPGRSVLQNARLFKTVTQATDDALIAVFDAKYHYGFWRPITAIRNGDLDGNDRTVRDPAWTPFIDTPMHPEYPCAHFIISATVGTILQAELGSHPTPTLTTTSPTAGGAARSWTSIDDFVTEVAQARIYDGVHFRNSTEVGTAMGRQIGALAARR